MTAAVDPPLDTSPVTAGEVLRDLRRADLLAPGGVVREIDPRNHAHPTFSVGIRLPDGWRFTDGTERQPTLPALVLDAPRGRHLRAVRP